MSLARPSALLSRLRADLSDRWQQGDRVRVEHYLAQYPDLESNPDALLELILGEAVVRDVHGDTPSLDEYVARFPQHADRLRSRWMFFLLSDEQARMSGPTLTAPAPSKQRLQLPIRIPGYVLEEVIGRGGMGIVFRARQEGLNRTVAIKLIRSGPLAGSEEAARFRNEATALSRLRHPQIISVHTFGEHQGCLYLVMDYVEGGTLADRLRQGPLPLREAAALVRDLARGIHLAHEEQVIHRDLKPANVLAGPRIADFGLASLLDTASDLTMTGVILGTPSYMAPEQARGVRHVGPSTDIHALGAILYECLTGKPPFQGKTRSETLEQVKHRVPVAPRALQPEIPAELEAICLQCLHKSPAERYTNAASLADDLENWLAGKPTQARPRSAWQRGCQWLHRRREPGVALAVVPLLFLGMTLLAEHPAEDRAEQNLQRRLEQNRPTTLLGAMGKPNWSRWVVGDAIQSQHRDGSFMLETWSMSLLELARSPMHTRFRLRAMVRHESSRVGQVGVFVGRHDYATRRGPGQFFLFTTYNDQEDESTMFRVVLGQAQKRYPDLMIPPPPAANAIKVRGGLDNSRGVRGTGLTTVSLLHSPTLKTGPPPRPWRLLEVEVRPEGVTVNLDRRRVGVLAQAALRRQIEGLWNSAGGLHPYLVGQPCVARFDPLGGVGLVVSDSMASFRDVVIEPLHE